MKNLSIYDFMDEHNACEPGRRWVAEMGFTTCHETFEALCNGKSGENGYGWALWFATRPGVLNQHELVGFAAWCARRVAYLLTDERSVKALELAERFAAGKKIPIDELKEAAAVAVDATRVSRAAHAARNAARDSADTAWTAADAASDPDAERLAQLEHLREIVRFEEAEALL